MTGEMAGEGTNGLNTILVPKTLRSGQSIKNGGNVVILGDVNPGAEVIAGGHVVVMGSVRGMVHAGAFGDENAMITAFCLKPTQLRISNTISRPPEGEETLQPVPETARIRNGMVVIEKYQAAR